MNDRLIVLVIVVVTSAWVLNLVAGILRWNDWEPDQAINVIFASIVGGAVTLYLRPKSKSRDE